jgi:hypothetical protein
MQFTPHNQQNAQRSSSDMYIIILSIAAYLSQHGIIISEQVANNITET